MNVLVTGGTGFVGSHTVEALLGAGHDVRLLVRSPDRIAPALGTAATRVDQVVGDACDADAVSRALEGCDAVVHAAAVFTWNPKRAEEMATVNARAAEVVLGTAAERGLDPIVYVSTAVALDLAAGPITGDSDIATLTNPYAASKAEGERFARRLQADGAPVVITHPGMVWGPRDPHFGETAGFARALMRGEMPVLPPGVMPIVDVRDVAAVHAAALAPGLGARRFAVVSENVPAAQVVELVRGLTGRKLRAMVAPRWLLRAIGGAADGAARVLPIEPGINSGIAWVASLPWNVDASETARALGVRFRPARETIADTILWLHEQGHLSDKHVGRLIAPAAAEPV